MLPAEDPADDPPGLLGARELYELILWLPDDGAFYASLAGGLAFHGWGMDRHLAANSMNLQSALLHGYMSVHAKNKPKRPEFFETPHAKKAREATAVDPNENLKNMNAFWAQAGMDGPPEIDQE